MLNKMSEQLGKNNHCYKIEKSYLLCLITLLLTNVEQYTNYIAWHYEWQCNRSRVHKRKSNEQERLDCMPFNVSRSARSSTASPSPHPWRRSRASVPASRDPWCPTGCSWAGKRRPSRESESYPRHQWPKRTWEEKFLWSKYFGISISANLVGFLTMNISPFSDLWKNT